MAPYYSFSTSKALIISPSPSTPAIIRSELSHSFSMGVRFGMAVDAQVAFVEVAN